MKFTQSLKKNYEFRRLYHKGVCEKDSFFAVYVRNNRSSENRLGITVSKKIGNAVCRNRLRRRVREIYRLSEYRMKTGFDIVVVGRMRAGESDYDKLSASLLKLLEKQGVLIKESDSGESSDAVDNPVLSEEHISG